MPAGMVASMVAMAARAGARLTQLQVQEVRTEHAHMTAPYKRIPVPVAMGGMAVPVVEEVC